MNETTFIYAFFLINKEVHKRGLTNLIRQKADALQLTLSPQTVVSDFKLPIKQLMLLMFSDNTQFQSCYYDYVKSLWIKHKQ